MSAPIDLDHLRRYTLDDPALLAEILGIFRDQAARLASSLDAGTDAASWRHAAHTLKGAARGVGAWALGEAAAHAERLSDAPPEDRAAALKSLVDLAAEASDYARDVIGRAA